MLGVKVRCRPVEKKIQFLFYTIIIVKFFKRHRIERHTFENKIHYLTKVNLKTQS